MIISLGGPVSGPLVQPTRDSRKTSRLPPQMQFLKNCHLRHCPCLALLLAGVTWPWHCCQRRWSLRPPFHPYRHRVAPALRRFVSVARSGRLLRPGCYPAPCPVECGLSSTLNEQGRDHPTSLRLPIIQYYGWVGNGVGAAVAAPTPLPTQLKLGFCVILGQSLEFCNDHWFDSAAAATLSNQYKSFFISLRLCHAKTVCCRKLEDEQDRQ